MKRKIFTGRPLKVVWAVDAFHEDPKTQLRAVQSFLKMSGGAGVSTIQPVAVLHAGSYDPSSRTFPKNWRELASAALGNLIDALKSVVNAGVLPVRLIKVNRPTLGASVDTLIQFAIEESAALILVHSHGRRGVERLTLGSFAETLVLRSPVPVLVTSPKASPHKNLTTWLYPTDFSAASKKGFDRIVTLASRLGAQILIYHKLKLPRSEPRLGIVLPPISQESIKALKAERAAVAAQWSKRAELSRVRTKFHIDKEAGPALDGILRAGRRLGAKALIAMSAQSGPWSAALVGSLTRQVLRSASCPVLVVHGEQAALLRKFAEDLQQLGYAYTAHPLIS